LNSAWDYAVHPDELRWALLFHDAIYDTRRHDNEERSAAWACQVMTGLGRPEDEKARVRGLILATAHAREPATSDEALLLDIDLSILGADAALFDAYDASIRAEYEWVPDDQYRQARAQVLSSFLGRERLYHTAAYRARFEATARRNLQRAME
jgi:predicted metal-dependent HD superfamily phosphohydrolase